MTYAYVGPIRGSPRGGIVKRKVTSMPTTAGDWTVDGMMYGDTMIFQLRTTA